MTTTVIDQIPDGSRSTMKGAITTNAADLECPMPTSIAEMPRMDTLAAMTETVMTDISSGHGPEAVRHLPGPASGSNATGRGEDIGMIAEPKIHIEAMPRTDMTVVEVDMLEHSQ